MSRFVFALALAVSASALSSADKFAQYKVDFAKGYDSVGVETKALSAFVENDKIIEATNAKNLSYWLGHNEFSDMSWEEFKAVYVSGIDQNPTLHRERNFDYSLLNETVTADAIDWDSKGAVTPVKNQGQCGSCWSFSTTGSVEGAFQIAGNPLTSLSEQNLVDCDTKKDNGCNGGLMDNAFTYIQSSGICTESDYPYTSGTSKKAGTCKTTCAKAVTVTGHTDVPGESAMIAALTKGPVSVAIEADKSAFQLYKGGVLDDSACGKSLDHGVLAMGFGTDSGKDYYKVKNSWGGTWGESGYIRMVRGKDQCGIADSASYPTGAKAAAPGPAPGPAPAGCSACLTDGKAWCYKDSQCHAIGSVFDPCSDAQCCSTATRSDCTCKSCTDTSCHA